MKMKKTRGGGVAAACGVGVLTGSFGRAAGPRGHVGCGLRMRRSWRLVGGRGVRGNWVPGTGIAVYRTVVRANRQGTFVKLGNSLGFLSCAFLRLRPLISAVACVLGGRGGSLTRLASLALSLGWEVVVDVVEYGEGSKGTNGITRGGAREVVAIDLLMRRLPGLA